MHPKDPGSTLSLLVLSVGLAVDVDSALSANHVAVLAKLLHRSSDLECSDWSHNLRRRKKRNGHGPKNSRANTRERTVHHGSQRKHGESGGGSSWLMINFSMRIPAVPGGFRIYTTNYRATMGPSVPRHSEATKPTDTELLVDTINDYSAAGMCGTYSKHQRSEK